MTPEQKKMDLAKSYASKLATKMDEVKDANGGVMPSGRRTPSGEMHMPWSTYSMHVLLCQSLGARVASIMEKNDVDPVAGMLIMREFYAEAAKLSQAALLTVHYAAIGDLGDLGDEYEIFEEEPWGEGVE